MWFFYQVVRAKGLIYNHYICIYCFLLYNIHSIALHQYDLLCCDKIRSSHIPVVVETKMVKLQEEAKNAGLKISATKTKEMRINSSVETKLTLNWRDMEQVNYFMYLGRIVTKTDGTDEEVRGHIRQVNGTFIQLCAVWKNKNILRRMKF